MHTLQAFARATAAGSQAKIRVFDWIKAAQWIVEKQPENVSAGLGGDWEWTGGRIYADGKPVPAEDTYVYLSSNWAIPEIDGDVIDCWVYAGEGNNWNSDTYWPQEALDILEGKTNV